MRYDGDFVGTKEERRKNSRSFLGFYPRNIAALARLAAENHCGVDSECYYCRAVEMFTSSGAQW